MDNVLITGASGFIGSFLTAEGLKRNYKVYAGIRSTSSRQYLTDPAIHFLEMDFSSEEKIMKTLEDCRNKGVKFRYVIHNAGITKSKKKSDYYLVNTQNTINFIQALIKSEMIPEKFIYMSSLAAYGPGNPVTMEPVSLSGTPNPVELYGKSKLEAENYIRVLNGFPWIIIRPTGVYGPREKDYFVYFQTMNRGFETYIGSRQQILTFIYVKDLVRLVFDAAGSSVSNKAYFVSDGREYDTQTFAGITKKVLGKKTLRIIVPAGLVKHIASGMESIFGLWGSVPTLNRDKYRVLSSVNWRCETGPLQKDFGFKAEYDLQKGVEETIAWYKANHWL